MNQDATLSLSHALREGWQGTKKNLWFLISVVFIFALLSSVPNIISAAVPKDREDGWFWIILLIVSLGSWILEVTMQMGLIKIALGIVNQQPVEYRHLFSDYRKLFTFIVASFLYGVIVIVGFLLFIIPGVYWSLKYQFFAYRIVDAGEGVFEALRKSGEMTQGVKLKLMGLSLLNMAIAFVGVLLLGVGLLVAIPVTMLTIASVYRQLAVRLTPVLPPAAPAPAATPGAA